MKRFIQTLVISLLISMFGGNVFAQENPNIIIFLADDFGYGCTNPYGASEAFVKTPGLNRLAEEGRMFTDASTPSSVCSPTRYALLTGRYNWRTGKVSGTYNHTDTLSIETNRPTIASMLKQNGYNTAHIGKWHLGYRSEREFNYYTKELSPGPRDIGFDYHFAVPVNNGGVVASWVYNEWVVGLNEPIPAGKERPAKNYSGKKLVDLQAPFRDDFMAQSIMLDSAKNWIQRQNSDHPFFMYYAFTAVHAPLTPGPQWQGTSGANFYGDFIQEIDGTVDEILNLLDSKGIADNTIVIFTSDNGWDSRWYFYDSFKAPENPALVIPQGFYEQLGGPFRGFKHSVWEGGFRVPYIVRWPGNVEPGTQCDEMINLIDTYATIASVLGVDMPSATGPNAGAEDSYNVLPAWLGDDYEKPIRDHMIQYNVNGIVGIRSGDYKFINGVPQNPKEKCTSSF